MGVVLRGELHLHRASGALGSFFSSGKRRHVVLQTDGVLLVFDDAKDAQPRERHDLKGWTLVADRPLDRPMFTLEPRLDDGGGPAAPHLQFRASSVQECQNWVSVLHRLLTAGGRRPTTPPPPRSSHAVPITPSHPPPLPAKPARLTGSRTPPPLPSWGFGDDPFDSSFAGAQNAEDLWGSSTWAEADAAPEVFGAPIAPRHPPPAPSVRHSASSLPPIPPTKPSTPIRRKTPPAPPLRTPPSPSSSLPPPPPPPPPPPSELTTISRSERRETTANSARGALLAAIRNPNNALRLRKISTTEREDEDDTSPRNRSPSSPMPQGHAMLRALETGIATLRSHMTGDDGSDSDRSEGEWEEDEWAV